MISQQEQNKIVPIGFFKLVLNNGCKYLNLSWTELEGNLSLKKMPQLKYLDLTMCKAEKEVFEDLLSFYMGKNTPTRQEFIIENLKVELDVIEEDL